MKRRKLLHGSKLIFLFLLFFSCKKDSYDGYDNQKVAIEFFSNTSKNPIVSKFISDMRITNSKKEFANDIVEKFGKPYWQFSNAFKGKGGITIITPIIDENDKEITSLLIGVYNNNRLYTHLVEEKIIKNVEQINNSGPDKNDYGYYFYHFNKSIFNRGPKVNDLVFKNGKLITYGALMLKERTLMGWVGNQWVNEKDWYQWDAYEQRWNYIDTTYEYGIDWEYVPDDPYTPPSEPYYPPSDPSGGGGTEPEAPIEPLEVIDSLDNPCFQSVKNRFMLSSNGHASSSNIGILLNLSFGLSNTWNIVFKDEQSMIKDGLILEGSAQARYNPQNPTQQIDVVITLSESALANSSQQYIAATLIHEIQHAYLRMINPSSVSDGHEYMASQEVRNMLQDGLLSAFPNQLSLQDAEALTWSGLNEDQNGNPITQAWTDFKTNNPASANQLQTIASQHAQGLGGIKCP